MEVKNIVKKLVEERLIMSISEGKRLISQGAIKINGEENYDAGFELQEGENVVILIGKHKKFEGKV